MQSRIYRVCRAYLILVFALSLSSHLHAAGVLDIDFGLAIFGGEELRLEKTKSPDFNVTLLRKYIIENAEKPLHHLHGITVLANLIKQSEELRAGELRDLARRVFRSQLKDKVEPSLIQLGELFFEGMSLAVSPAADAKPADDRAFEDLLLKAEDTLIEKPEYWLVKGILFHLLAGRPSGYFSPMKPLEDLKQAASKTKGDPHFFFVLGQAFRVLGNSDQNLYFAIQSFERAAALNPTNPRLQNTLLGLYMGLHEGYQGNRKAEPFWLEEAVYRKILTLHPGNPHAMNNLGYLYAEYGINRQEAHALCQRAVDQMPNNPSFRDSLGWAAFKNGNFDIAERELLKAISMNADMYDPYYHLGTVYYVTKRFDQAVQMYEKAITIKPNAAESLNNYAYLLTELDRELTKAQQMATKAVALEPNNPSYLDTLAWAEFKLGNYDEAMRLLRKALQLAPDVGEILAHAGRVSLQLKRFDEGLDLLKRALKADPNLESIQKDIFLAIQTRSTFQAIADYHMLFGEKANPRHLTSLLLNLTRLYQEEGNFKEAIAITQLCDRIHRGELPLNAPLFPSYVLPATASSTAASSTDLPGVPSEGGDTPASDQDQSLEGTDFPTIARIPMGLAFGPVVFRQLQRRLAAFPQLDKLSAALFIRNARHPYLSAVVRFEFPGLGEKNPLSVLAYALHSFGVSPELSDPSGERPQLLASFAQRPLWAVQLGDQTYIGFGTPPESDELASLSQTLPYADQLIAGFLLDWDAVTRNLSPLLTALTGNPLGSFRRVYALYVRDVPEVREISFIEPIGPLTPNLMQTLTEELYFYRLLLFNVGIKASIRVEANDTGIRLTTEYSGIKAAWQQRKPVLALVFSLLRRPLESFGCRFRRSLFGGGPAELAHVCPSGGTVFVSPHTGALHCSAHEGFGYLPCPVRAVDRCAFSRIRLEMLLRQGTRQKADLEGLLKQLIIDYNIPPCPHGGVYVIGADGKVSCTIHRETEPVKSAPAQEEK